jgi:hypothetical protein
MTPLYDPLGHVQVTPDRTSRELFGHPAGAGQLVEGCALIQLPAA